MEQASNKCGLEDGWRTRLGAETLANLDGTGMDGLDRNEVMVKVRNPFGSRRLGSKLSVIIC